MSAGRRGTEDAKRARGMKAVKVMTWLDGIAQTTGDFHTCDVGDQKRAARQPFGFGDCQSSGQDRRGRMNLLACWARRQSRQLSVVVVEHMGLHAVN